MKEIINPGMMGPNEVKLIGTVICLYSKFKNDCEDEFKIGNNYNIYKFGVNMAERLRSIRCHFCRALLALGWIKEGSIEIKCRKCKRTNSITIPAKPVIPTEQKGKA